MEKLKVPGIAQNDLDLCVEKVEEIQSWASSEKIDRWALRAALLKAIYEDADDYFAKSGGTFREIAAFDNGVATAIDSRKK